MKQLLLTFFGLMAMTCLGLQAENRIVTDTIDGKKRVIELQDTVVDGQNVTDTLSITTYEGKREPTVTKIEKGWGSIEIKDDGEYLFGVDRDLWNLAIIPIVAIVFVFGLPALLIFIIPPSFEELSRRLHRRNTDSEEVIAGRLEKARVEFREIPNYDYLVINDKVSNAVEEIEAILTAAECRVENRSSILSQFA